MPFSNYHHSQFPLGFFPSIPTVNHLSFLIIPIILCPQIFIYVVHADEHLEDYAFTKSRDILFLRHFHLSNPASHLSLPYIYFSFCAYFFSLVLIVCFAFFESPTSQVIIIHTERKEPSLFHSLGYHYYGPSSG